MYVKQNIRNTEANIYEKRANRLKIHKAVYEELCVNKGDSIEIFYEDKNIWINDCISPKLFRVFYFHLKGNGTTSLR